MIAQLTPDTAKLLQELSINWYIIGTSKDNAVSYYSLRMYKRNQYVIARHMVGGKKDILYNGYSRSEFEELVSSLESSGVAWDKNTVYIDR